MRAVYSLVALILIVAGLALFAVGAGYLFTEQANAIQQNAAGSLATAFFVAGWACWWVAAQASRARGALGPNQNIRE